MKCEEVDFSYIPLSKYFIQGEEFEYFKDPFQIEELYQYMIEDEGVLEMIEDLQPKFDLIKDRVDYDLDLNPNFIVGSTLPVQKLFSNTEIMLKDKILCWRQIKPDCNSFYRAVMFAYIENLILNKDILMLKHLISKSYELLEKVEYEPHKNILTKSISLLAYITYLMERIEVSHSDRFLTSIFLMSINSEHEFDLGLNVLMRIMICEVFKPKHNCFASENDLVPLFTKIPAQFYDEVSEYYLIDRYVNEYLLNPNLEPDELSIKLACYALNINLSVITLGNSEFIFNDFICQLPNKQNISIMRRNNRYDIGYDKAYTIEYIEYLASHTSVSNKLLLKKSDLELDVKWQFEGIPSKPVEESKNFKILNSPIHYGKLPSNNMSIVESNNPLFSSQIHSVDLCKLECLKCHGSLQKLNKLDKIAILKEIRLQLSEAQLNSDCEIFPSICKSCVEDRDYSNSGADENIANVLEDTIDNFNVFCLNDKKLGNFSLKLSLNTILKLTGCYYSVINKIGNTCKSCQNKVNTIKLDCCQFCIENSCFQKLIDHINKIEGKCLCNKVVSSRDKAKINFIEQILKLCFVCKANYHLMKIEVILDSTLYVAADNNIIELNNPGRMTHFICPDCYTEKIEKHKVKTINCKICITNHCLSQNMDQPGIHA